MKNLSEYSDATHRFDALYPTGGTIGTRPTVSYLNTFPALHFERGHFNKTSTEEDCVDVPDADQHKTCRRVDSLAS